MKDKPVVPQNEPPPPVKKGSWYMQKQGKSHLWRN